MTSDSIQPDRKTLYLIILAFAAIYLIWGTTYLVIAIAVETMPPFLMAGTRFLLSGLLIFLFLRARGEPVPKRLHWRSAAIIGILLLAGGSGLVAWSETRMPSGTVALIVATVPLWMALLDWLIFKGSRPGRRVAIGLLLGLTGMALLIGPGQILGTAEFSVITLLILLCSPIFWSLGSHYSRQIDLPHNIFMSTAMELLAGGALLLIAGLLTGEAGQLAAAEIPAHALAALAYLIIMGSIVAYTAYVWLLKHVQPTKVATYAYVNPVIAVFLGWLILDEVVDATTIAAAVIIVLSVFLITAGGSTPAPAQQPELAQTLPLPLAGDQSLPSSSPLRPYSTSGRSSGGPSTSWKKRRDVG